MARAHASVTIVGGPYLQCLVKFPKARRAEHRFCFFFLTIKSLCKKADKGGHACRAAYNLNAFPHI
jgi:hypothetical protein